MFVTFFAKLSFVPLVERTEQGLAVGPMRRFDAQFFLSTVSQLEAQIWKSRITWCESFRQDYQPPFQKPHLKTKKRRKRRHMDLVLTEAH
ncbi:hypothetical protein TcWFU_005141 [Taenia crassiceps]|uniref:Uncharacterized protein n=1 Tax=Taenia crassiceps TaxID=6207 RepID=A0ABR4QHX3_9CEST